jgi:hypothetical protein
MAPVIRHLVLDNEAVTALHANGAHDAKRKAVVLAIAAANGRKVVPTAVRVEAGWDRTAARSANVNRLLPAGTDVVLGRAGADRAAQLRASVPGASVVEATVAVAAEEVGRNGDVVEILTSDVSDLRALSVHLGAQPQIKPI